MLEEKIAELQGLESEQGGLGAERFRTVVLN